MADINGGQAIVNVLKAFGVTQFFNVPGESFLPVLDAIGAEPSIRLVTNRHESGASFAAEGFAKISGRPAVCMATRGPGASNLSIGIQTALYDSTPMVALVGLVPTELQGTQAFQEFDPGSMFDSLAKRTFVVASRATLEATIAQALTEATVGRPGPVLVGIPADLLSAHAPPAPFGFADTKAEGEPDVSPLLERLRSAARPAFIVSTAAVRGRLAADLGDVAKWIGAPVLCGWRRFSAFDNGHPRFAGSLGLGMPASVRATLDRADLVVGFGPLEQVTIDSGQLNREGLEVINVSATQDANLARRLNRARVVEVVARPEAVARELVRAIPDSRTGARGVDPAAAAEPLGRQALTAASAISLLNQSAGGDVIIVSDAGDFAQPLLRDFKFDRERSFIGPVNGAMGYGLPAAIGARLADPSRPVVCLAGDGGLLMTAGEMETAVRIRADLTAIVFNNRAFGTIKSRQAEAFPGREFGTSLGEVCFTEIAKGMGWKAWSARSVPEFEAALNSADSTTGCRLIEVHLNGS